jgi:hypothetical protein
MAIQSEHHIELNDIVGLRIICEQCQCSLTCVITGRIVTKVLQGCAQCSRTWKSDDGSGAATSMEPAISSFVNALLSLKNALANRVTGDACSIELQVDAGAWPNPVERKRYYL